MILLVALQYTLEGEPHGAHAAGERLNTLVSKHVACQSLLGGHFTATVSACELFFCKCVICWGWLLFNVRSHVVRFERADMQERGSA